MASLNEQKPDSSPSTLNGAEESHDLEKQPSQTAATDLARTLTQTMVPDLEQNVSRTTAPEIQGPKFPETDLDQGLVGWDGQDDPENPQNFASSKKWALLALISAFTFLSPLASSMFSPAVVFMAKEFHQTNETILAFTVSIYLVGYVVSDKLEIIGSQTSSTSTVVLTVRNLIYSSVLWYLPPLSEIYGRRVVLSGANWFFVVWQIGCALAKNIETLIVCRLFAGIGGSACITLGAGVVADLFPIEMRGMATSIWSMGPLIGPVVGPIAGGFLGEEVSWQWIFWLLLIAGGAMQLGIELLNKEIRPYSQLLKRSLIRPALLLFKSPIVLLLSIYMSLVYGLLYLFFTTISDVFTSTYGFTVGLSGLAYLGIGVGFFGGLVFIALTNDRIVQKLTAQNKGKFEPEMRLPTMIIFACILPISFFWYGWTADKHVHWIVPIIGMFPFGVGMMGVFMPIQTYIIDCYPAYAASANATLTATRSLVGAFLPLAGPAMFDSLGLGWGNSLLGFLALAFVPIPIIFTKYGKTIREKWPVNL
ncbi:hypothetical protein N7509_008892 [Penicillium cosmopolitanum]|uniref:Major facilitator superfamily (MFS) profile domain-containing protein n=1 Tax=Penicillium cosmopolitanum TaxID=1131564 RepID=A0A9W9VNG0_9EURO|nr:uncharacterized protein N7509_008892 [Penicillium cosmopolitanum]KAJ5386351.1 hypothetical protein N7509_008892 [Penicillium cosmopolitanum]